MATAMRRREQDNKLKLRLESIRALTMTTEELARIAGGGSARCADSNAGQPISSKGTA